MPAFVAVVVVIIALVFVVMISTVARRAHLASASQNWPTVTGTVVDVKRRSQPNMAASQAAGPPVGSIQQARYVPIIEFTASDGVVRRINGKSTAARSRAQGEIGERVIVAYNPDKPAQAVVRPG